MFVVFGTSLSMIVSSELFTLMVRGLSVIIIIIVNYVANLGVRSDILLSCEGKSWQQYCTSIVR